MADDRRSGPNCGRTIERVEFCGISAILKLHRGKFRLGLPSVADPEREVRTPVHVIFPSGLHLNGARPGLSSAA